MKVRTLFVTYYFVHIVGARNEFFLSSHWVAILLKLKTVSGGPVNCYVTVMYVVLHGQLLLVTHPH